MSGYWTTRTFRNPDTGGTITRRFWVDTTAQTEAAARAAAAARASRLASARRRSASAARAAAERARARALGLQREREAELRMQAAARIERQKRLVAARRASYEALQRRQAELLRQRNIVKAKDYVAERDDLRRDQVAMRAQQQKNAQAAQVRQSKAEANARNSAYQKRLLLMKLNGTYYGAGNRWNGKQVGAEVGGLAPEDVKSLEQVVKAEAERAKGGQFDTASVEKFRDAYEKYATKVYDEYENVIVAINAAIDKGNVTRARALYENYKRLLPEFQRLFGNGRNALKDGAYNQFYQQYQNIGLAQRDWWKSQMKASLERTAEGDDRPGRDNSNADEARQLLDIINGKTKTRRVADGVDSHGRPKYRYFTIEEELAARQAEKKMQMEQLRAQWGAQQHAIRVQMMREGYSEYKGQYIERALVPVAKHAEAIMQKFYGGKFEPTRPHDIHEFVDKMLADWEAQQPKPKITGKGSAQLRLQLSQWESQRKRYEDEAYRFFGMGPQGILEKGMDTPGIRDALALLSGPFAAVGSGARVANAAIFGSTKVGGVTPTLYDAPPHIKKIMDELAAKVSGGGPVVGPSAFILDLVKKQYFDKWVQTPEGQIWWKRVVAERTAKDSQDARDFNEGFYGENARNPDLLKGFNDRLAALNNFGNSPFQNEGANLLSSLLLDPLNAVPLKFTTYLARGKYALEASQGLSKVTRPLTATRTFLSVDEGTLGVWKHFRGLEKELAEKGMSRDRFLDILRERVQGVKTAAERNSATRQLFREIGLDPQKVNESQLYNLTEHLVNQKIGEKGLDFFSQADELSEKLTKAEKAAAEGERARAALAKSEQERVTKSLRARETEAKAARRAESGEMVSLKARLTEKVAAERARQAGAAKAVAGPSSPARTPRTGAAGTIETKMAAGDVAGSQADNIVEGVARGGTVESGGAMKPNAPTNAAERPLTLRERVEMTRSLGSSASKEAPRPPAKGAPRSSSLLERILASDGGAGAAPPEVTHAPHVEAAQSFSDAEVLLQRLGTMSEEEWYASVKAKQGAILVSKKSTSVAKATARKRLAQVKMAERAMEVEKKGGSYVSWKDRANFQKRVLKMFGKDAEGYVAPRLVAPLIQSSRDAVVEQARTYYKLLRSASSMELTGVPGIRIKGRVVDFMPMDVFRELDKRISAAISEARGYTADTVTRSRGRLNADDPDAINALGRMSDRDPVVIKAKKEALKKYAADTGNVVSLAAYDEARKVLWKGYVQNRTALRLLALAKKKVGAYGGDLEKAYLALRDETARRESKRQLGGMAFGKFYGMNPSVIFGEFAARYSDDGTIRHFQPELTGFQRRTLEANFAALAGRSSDDANVSEFLQGANRPPLENREMTREFQKKIGAWAPRLAEDFVQGKKSWSVLEEAQYWRDNFGAVPDWANVDILSDAENGAGMIFHDQYRYIEQMKAWGVFSRSQELALRMDGKTAAEIEEAVLKGDPELGLPARRALELQRRFVIERFGDLVSKDGKTLDAMPWLMHEDELHRYIGRQTIKDMPEGFIRTEKELEEATALISKAIDKFWDRYIGVKAADGPIHYHDVFRLASEVQAQLLANPKWARRYRDVFGKGLNTWSWLNRWLVFSNPAFAIVNVIDAPIKTAWYRFTRRGLFNRSLVGSSLAKKADELTPQMFNWDATPAMYRAKQLKARQRVVKPRGLTDMDRVVDRALGLVQATGEVFPEVAGKAELAMRLRLAKGMYPEVYRQALKRFPDEELAHAAALDFIKREVSKMWPTAGDGPLEQLWNRFVPFASYTLRNKVLWISEAVAHPVVLNDFDRIGRFIEAHNMREWEKEHPGTEMPENLRRLIELPWAKGYYIDLAQFTDASRGLKPLTDTSWKSNLERLTDWFRVVSPTMQAGIYAVFNAFNLFPRLQWQLGEDGQYHEVVVPYLEPWSKDAADASSVFWLVEAIEKGTEYGIDGWSAGEVSAMVGQVLFFNAVKTYDKFSVLYGWYKGLSKQDQKTFLDTADGQMLMEWLNDRARTSDFKGDLLGMMADHDADPAKWWYVHQPDGWKKRLNEGRDKITAIRNAFATRLYTLTPGTAEYRAMKARMYLAIGDVYGQYPELLESEVFTKTASEWASQLQDWQADKLMDDFMALADQRPQRAQYESSAAYNKAVANWERQKAIFLNTYPQVKKRLAGEIVEVENVRDRIEKQWDMVLSRVAKRNEAIEAAKAIIDRAGRKTAAGRDAQDRLDLLYLQNDLDYSLLERDYAATYFSKDDFERLPGGALGPLKQPGLLRRATTFIDFDRAIYEKNLKAGTLEEYLAKGEYGAAMKAAMLAAKGGDPFGKFDPAKWFKYMQDHPALLDGYFRNNPGKKMEWANSARYIEGIRALWKQAGNDPSKWVQLLKQDKWLLREYFSRNPGKEREWARTDAYIRNISVWGKLVGASRWDEANAVWDRMPKWVKDMYYARHPGRREKAQQTAQYLGYMDKWVKLFEAKDEEGAMKYFHSLPKWAQERYFKAHPENRLKFTASEELSAHLRNYFAAEPKYRGDYLAKNPEFKRWLVQNGDSKNFERFAILQAYQTIPKGETWLRKVFRDRYPEIFSQEAAGEARLKRVYDTLSKQPGVLPEFEKWVAEVWRTYEEMLRLGKARPVSSYFIRDREEEKRMRALFASRSAAEVSG